MGYAKEATSTPHTYSHTPTFQAITVKFSTEDRQRWHFSISLTGKCLWQSKSIPKKKIKKKTVTVYVYEKRMEIFALRWSHHCLRCVMSCDTRNCCDRTKHQRKYKWRINLSSEFDWQRGVNSFTITRGMWESAAWHYSYSYMCAIVVAQTPLIFWEYTVINISHLSIWYSYKQVWKDIRKF